MKPKTKPRSKIQHLDQYLDQALMWIKDAQKRVHDGAKTRKIDLVDLSDSLAMAHREIQLAKKERKR